MDCAADALAVVDSLEARGWVGFNDGNFDYMSEVKRFAPEVPVFWDRPANFDIDLDIRIDRERGFESLLVNHEGVAPEKVSKIHAAGFSAGT